MHISLMLCITTVTSQSHNYKVPSLPFLPSAPLFAMVLHLPFVLDNEAVLLQKKLHEVPLPAPSNLYPHRNSPLTPTIPLVLGSTIMASKLA
jgi:hypothetical protein